MNTHFFACFSAFTLVKGNNRFEIPFKFFDLRGYRKVPLVLGQRT